jgi:hypothetical protein
MIYTLHIAICVQPWLVPLVLRSWDLWTGGREEYEKEREIMKRSTNIARRKNFSLSVFYSSFASSFVPNMGSALLNFPPFLSAFLTPRQDRKRERKGREKK